MTAEPHSRRLLWIVAGIALLVGTILGASHILSPGGHDGGAAMPDPLVAKSIFALGYIENDPGVFSPPVQQGKIKFVAEEGFVADKAGVILLELDDRLAKLEKRKAEADLESSRALLELAKLFPQQLKLKGQQQNAAIDGAREEKTMAEQELQLKDKAFKDKIIPKQELFVSEAKVKALTAKVQAEESKLQELKLTDGQAQVEQAQANVHAKEAQLEEAKLGLDACKIVAPGPGTVLRVWVHEGEFYSPQARIPALQFAPNGAKIVRAEILQEWASKVEKGQKVEIIDDTYESAKWTGSVKRVAEWQSKSRDVVLEPFNFNDTRTLECIITVDEKSIADTPQVLRIGQRVRVKILTGN